MTAIIGTVNRDAIETVVLLSKNFNAVTEARNKVRVDKEVVMETIRVQPSPLAPACCPPQMGLIFPK